jgi:hypothetical protein
MDDQILAALIVAGVTIFLSLMSVLWQGARQVERLKSIQFAAKVRQEAIDKRWQIHEDRHNRMEIRLDRMERFLQDRR